ncbi:hypothetical protein F7725_013393 [Dissostichus mawsoni]|uniref:Receptor ligand binding region domain-containing protein n=1 Tax=Dissostichus mawsoni TaxID=36200 RepID=A0A7J5YRS6_DISMA|nr:hypothetical protein F7725_013393 [Dissostichus mawsoni]
MCTAKNLRKETSEEHLSNTLSFAAGLGEGHHAIPRRTVCVLSDRPEASYDKHHHRGYRRVGVSAKNNSYPFSYARVAPAILYAQQRLQAEGGQYSGIHFNIHFENSDCVNGALFLLLDRSCGQKPDLILGPVCEYEAAAVIRLASHWDIPVISAGALAAGFSNKNTEFSQLTRIAPSYVKMAETFTAMFEHFTWRSALLLFEDDKQERNCYFTLEGVYHLMADFNIKSYAVSMEELVIMCMGADRIREVMLAAHRRRLTNGSYMFFNVELFNASSYGKEMARGSVEINMTAMRAGLCSLNTVTLLRTVKPEFEKFSMEMKKSVENLGFMTAKTVGVYVNMFVEGFHDAMLLYAIALHEAMKNGYRIAGQVSMDVNGDRNGDFSLMAMTNVDAGTYEVVANYFGENGTFQLLPAFNSEHFTLRGRHKEQPEIPDKSCGLGVSALTGVIVGAVLGTALLIAFYFFRKNYRITIERRTHGEECDTGKHRQLREDSIRSNFSAA